MPQPRNATVSHDPNDDTIVDRLDWNLLRTFIVILQAGSISHAAEILNQTQPTVSLALKRLENQLGRHLIDRGPAHFEPTEYGEKLYEEALEIRGTVHRITTLLRDMSPQVRGHVKLNIASHVVSPILDKCLHHFSQAYPLATLEIEVMASRHIQASLIDRKASLGICLVSKKHSSLCYHHMFSEYFGLFCGENNTLFGQKNITEEDLQNVPSVSFVTDQMSDALRPVTLMRARLGLTDHLVGKSANLEEVRRMITSGVGVGPLPLHVVRRELEEGTLFQLPPYENLPKIDVYAAWNPLAKFNRAEQAFLQLLRNSIDELPPEDRDYTS